MLSESIMWNGNGGKCMMLYPPNMVQGTLNGVIGHVFPISSLLSLPLLLRIAYIDFPVVDLNPFSCVVGCALEILTSATTSEARDLLRVIRAFVFFVAFGIT